MNFVFNNYINKTLDVLLGPICDYVLAPVVRQAYFWNISVLSIGGSAKDFVFMKKTHYQMLTKVGPVQPTYYNNFFNSLAAKFSWDKIAVVRFVSDLKNFRGGGGRTLLVKLYFLYKIIFFSN